MANYVIEGTITEITKKGEKNTFKFSGTEGYAVKQVIIFYAQLKMIQMRMLFQHTYSSQNEHIKLRKYSLLYYRHH